MRCTLVFHLVATIFVIVYSAQELCEYEDYYGKKHALYGRNDVDNILNFIPPISQNITLIDLMGQPLKQLPYNAFRNLNSQSDVSAIWLESCKISHVDAGALLNLHNLTAIDLSHNYITQIDSKLFSDTKRIKYIYLHHNNIEVVPSGIFQDLTLLEEVFLFKNRIRQVEWFSFKNTPSLQLIGLHYNQIEFINMLFKDKFDNLTYLWLGDNPWKCNCELGPLYELVFKKNLLLNEDEPVCEKPPTLQGRQWRQISRDEFICSSEDAASTEDSVMTSTEPMTTTEAVDNIPVIDYNRTKYQPVDTDVPPPPSNQNWIPYTILVLVLACAIPVIIGVVFVVRYTRMIVRRRSARRTNAHNMDSDLSMLFIRNRAVSERGDSASNMDDMDEEQTSIHHCEIREATIN